MVVIVMGRGWDLVVGLVVGFVIRLEVVGRGERMVLAVMVGMATAAAIVKGFAIVELRMRALKMIADVVGDDF